MEKQYQIHGLDCANCAAKLERKLQEISEFEDVTIDFMGRKLLLTVKDEQSLITGMEKAWQIIKRTEPNVTLNEKGKKAAIKSHEEQHHHEHGEHCSCGHEHSHEEHHHHEHGESCGCGHEHGHEHHHHEHGESCGCGHEHGHEHHHHENEEHSHVHDEGHGFSQRIIKLLLSGALFGTALTVPTMNLKLVLFLAAYCIVGGDVLLRAAKNILRGQIFDENFLMAIATVGAFCIGEYPEGVAVMLFYQLGELFQDYAVNRSRESITALMDIRPDIAYIQKGNQVIAVAPEEVSLGEIIVIKPGDKIPLDGVILEGASSLDTQAITGEAIHKNVAEGDFVLSGCVNISGLLKVRVEKEYAESTVAQILDLVENASSKKAQTEKFITRFARYYTPIVVIVAAFLAVVPPLVLQQEFSAWIYRALVFLVISCPCALVISIPLSFFGGLGACSKRGVLIKGSNYLEALAQVDTVVFDKTGTLTKGSFKVTEVQAIQGTTEEILAFAAHGEAHSTHPIALALRQAYQHEIDLARIDEVQEIAGYGIKAVIDGKKVLVGNQKLLQQKVSGFTEADVNGTVIYVAVDGVYAGYILIADEIKEDSKLALEKLKQQGIQQTVMLTGDNQAAAEQIASQLKIDQVYSELLPGDKVTKLEMLTAQQKNNGKIAFVGDGINDAPVLARADVGVAMGGLGSDAAIEAADVVIMTDEPSKLADAIILAKKTMMIAKQNIIFTLAVKFAVLLAGVFGMATMWAAVFADVGVAFLAILNAVRILVEPTLK